MEICRSRDDHSRNHKISRQAFAGEFIDLYWNTPYFAVPSVRLGIRFCHVACATHAGDGRVDLV